MKKDELKIKKFLGSIEMESKTRDDMQKSPTTNLFLSVKRIIKFFGWIVGTFLLLIGLLTLLFML